MASGAFGICSSPSCLGLWLHPCLGRNPSMTPSVCYASVAQSSRKKPAPVCLEQRGAAPSCKILETSIPESAPALHRQSHSIICNQFRGMNWSTSPSRLQAYPGWLWLRPASDAAHPAFPTDLTFVPGMYKASRFGPLSFQGEPGPPGEVGPQGVAGVKASSPREAPSKAGLAFLGGQPYLERTESRQHI